MSVFVLVVAPVFTALFGVLFATVLALQPPGLPLSVRVPQSHLGDPIIRTSIRSFRLRLVVAWVLTLLLVLLLATANLTALATVLPVLLYAALSIGALMVSRRQITRAKREGKWFDGVPVRMTAQITPTERHHTPIIWPLLALVVLAVATAVNVALYPTLPDPIAVHFTAGGVPDELAAKSVWSVFGVLIMGAAVVVLLTVLSAFASRYSARTQSDDSAEQARLRTRVQRWMLTSLLSELSFAIALGISAIVLAQRLAPGVKAVTAASAIGLLILVMAVVIVNVARGRAQLGPANVRDSRSPRPDAVDDDRHWKGGLFYVNRDDPSIIVPRRLGLGWTMNLGRPGGLAITILLVVVLAAGVTTLILTAHGR